MTKKILLIMTILPAMIYAESSLTGNVADTTGAAMPGVRVVAAQVGTAAVRETVTDDTGHFRIPNLPIGSYTLRCERSGFQTVEIKPFPLSINQVLDQRIEMKLAAVS